MKMFLILLLLVAPVMACPSNSIEQNGVCADMQAPQTEPPVNPSDELPPSHGGKREAVQVDMPQSEIAKDLAQNAAKMPNGGVPER